MIFSFLFSVFFSEFKKFSGSFFVGISLGVVKDYRVVGTVYRRGRGVGLFFREVGAGVSGGSSIRSVFFRSFVILVRVFFVSF